MTSEHGPADEIHKVTHEPAGEPEAPARPASDDSEEATEDRPADDVLGLVGMEQGSNADYGEGSV